MPKKKHPNNTVLKHDKEGRFTSEGRPERPPHKRDARGKFVAAPFRRPCDGADTFWKDHLQHLEMQINNFVEQIDRHQGDPIDYLFKALRHGCPPSVACRAIGITEDMYDLWRREVEAGTSKRADILTKFFVAVDRARGEAISEILGQLKEHGTDNPRCWPALAWILERTEQETFVVKRAETPQVQVQLGLVTAMDALNEADHQASLYVDPRPPGDQEPANVEPYEGD